MTEIEDVIARIGRLKPRISYVNLDESTGGRPVGGFVWQISRNTPGPIDRYIGERRGNNTGIGYRGTRVHDEAAPPIS